MYIKGIVMNDLEYKISVFKQYTSINNMKVSSIHSRLMRNLCDHSRFYNEFWLLIEHEKKLNSIKIEHYFSSLAKAMSSKI